MREYIEQKYGSILDQYEENYGLNGMDYLWSLQTKEEVDELLGPYLNN